MAGVKTLNGSASGRQMREEVAAYVATLSRDLSTLSRRNGLPTLAYLLDMAQLEADSVAGPAAVLQPILSSEPESDLP